LKNFNNKKPVENLSVVVPATVAKKLLPSAGQYFEVKIEYTDITAEELEVLERFENNLSTAGKVKR
jgi:type I restriction enzyme M protein